jgi:hypothetical protein
MKSEEHALMITMFAKQLQLIEALGELLRSRCIMDEGDFDAFRALVHSDPERGGQLLLDAAELYKRVAEGLGIEIGSAPG